MKHFCLLPTLLALHLVYLHLSNQIRQCDFLTFKLYSPYRHPAMRRKPSPTCCSSTPIYVSLVSSNIITFSLLLFKSAFSIYIIMTVNTAPPGHDRITFLPSHNFLLFLVVTTYFCLLSFLYTQSLPYSQAASQSA